VTRLDLVGRAAELNELAHAWSRVTATSTAGAAVITGAAGIGKTRLINAAVASFRPRPARVLAGSARVHSPAPYDWLAGILSTRRSALSAPADAVAWLAQDPDLPRERYAPDALLRIAVRVVRELVGEGPAVLVVDDLHALDPASLNLVAELAGAADVPALMLMASRPATDAVSPALVELTLARVSGSPDATREHLGPLRLADTAAALDRLQPDVEPDVVAAIHRRCRGNPYQLMELIAAAGGDLNAAVPSADAAALISDLTARERDVLACLTKGMSNKEVARALGISVRTVGVHVSNLLRKTRSASRVDAAVLAVRAGDR
jgi:DNA-binding CsgD family transcriptional regulator